MDLCGLIDALGRYVQWPCPAPLRTFPRPRHVPGNNDFKLSLGTFSTLYAVRAMQTKYALYKLEPAISFDFVSL
jgi:hypothetical protein